jgi:hypothetical protein
MNEAHGKKGARVIDRQGPFELVRYAIDAETESPLYVVYDSGQRIDWLDCIDSDSPYADDPTIEEWQSNYL